MAPIVALLLFAAPAADVLPRASPESVGLSSERLARVGEVFREEVRAGRIPGAVLAVARDGRLAYLEAIGFRDPSTRAPMTTDAIFRLYSMTKPFVSVVAMMLVEEGRLQLADPISKYLPQLKGLGLNGGKSPAREVTIHDLLRHTAGLPYVHSINDPALKEAWARAGFAPHVEHTFTPDGEIAALAKVPLSREPGTAWEYGYATDVLGRVLEAISGKRLGDLLEERLFSPLGMRDTSFRVPADRRARVAGTIAGARFPSGSGLLDVAEAPRNDSGGLGAYGTAADYLRFAQALLDGGRAGDVRLLSPTTVAFMTSDHVRDLPDLEVLFGPGYGFGLGFAVRRSDGAAFVAGSRGEYYWAGAAGTLFWVDPRERLVAVMMLQLPGDNGPWRRLFKTMVTAAIVEARGTTPDGAGVREARR